MNGLILAAAAAGGLAFAALGLSMFALWRGVRAQSSIEATLREGLRLVDESVASIPPPPKLDTSVLDSVREDITSFGGLLSSLAKGHEALRDGVTETVTEAMGAAAAELNAQITEADRRALTRNEALRDEQQKIAETLEGLSASLSDSIKADIAPVTETTLALSAQIAAFAKAGPAPAEGAPAAVAPAAASVDTEALRAALAQTVADAVARNLSTAMENAAATLGDEVAEKLRAVLAAEFAARAARGAGGGDGGSARAPSIFNSGRVVSLARPTEAPAKKKA